MEQIVEHPSISYTVGLIPLWAMGVRSGARFPPSTECHVTGSIFWSINKGSTAALPLNETPVGLGCVRFKNGGDC